VVGGLHGRELEEVGVLLVGGVEEEGVLDLLGLVVLSRAREEHEPRVLAELETPLAPPQLLTRILVDGVACGHVDAIEDVLLGHQVRPLPELLQ